MSKIKIIDRCPDCSDYHCSDLDGDHWCSNPKIIQELKWSKKIADQADNYKGEIPSWCPLEDKK